MSACSFSSGSPCGGGILAMIVSKTSSTPIPVLALHVVASVASIPIISSISSQTFSGSADGRSILFKIGITSKFCSIAV